MTNWDRKQKSRELLNTVNVLSSSDLQDVTNYAKSRREEERIFEPVQRWRFVEVLLSPALMVLLFGLVNLHSLTLYALHQFTFQEMLKQSGVMLLCVALWGTVRTVFHFALRSHLQQALKSRLEQNTVFPL
jgi:hypothetical protein